MIVAYPVCYSQYLFFKKKSSSGKFNEFSFHGFAFGCSLMAVCCIDIIVMMFLECCLPSDFMINVDHCDQYFMVQ